MNKRKTGIFRRLAVLCLAWTAFGAFPGLAGLSAQDTRVETEILWDRGLLKIRVESLLPESELPLPAVKLSQQQAIRRALPAYLRTALQDLTIDSYLTFPEALNQSPDLLPVLDTLTAAAAVTADRLSLDLRHLIMEFQVSLFPYLTEPFLVPGYTPQPRELLSWEPSAAFTGIVIYAGESLPVHGERDSQGKIKMAPVTPCLFPKIFDQEMNLILSPDLMDQDNLALGGVALYTRKTDPADLIHRVGNYPFYTTALGLFGKNSTDLLLPSEDVRRLLSREENRELLRQGRIVIVY